MGKENAELDPPETDTQPLSAPSLCTATCLRGTSRTGLCLQCPDCWQLRCRGASRSHLPALTHYKLTPRVNNCPCTSSESAVMPGLTQDLEFIKKTCEDWSSYVRAWNNSNKRCHPSKRTS